MDAEAQNSSKEKYNIQKLQDKNGNFATTKNLLRSIYVLELCK